MKQMRKLSHHDLRSLASLCAGFALMLAVAVSFSDTSVPAGSQVASFGCFTGVSCSVNVSYFYVDQNPLDYQTGTVIHAAGSTSGTKCWLHRDDWSGGYIGYAQGWPITVGTGALTESHTYYLECAHGSLWSRPNLTVTVNPPPPPEPTVSISGDTSATVGQPANIYATFAAGDGDGLVYTAINDWYNNALTSWDAGDKQYTFTPPGPGSYTFYPAVQTNYYSWNNYGQSLTMYASCPAGTTDQGGSCVSVCAAGQTYQGGSCVSVCAAGQTYQNGACTPSCPSGQVYQAGACVVPTCTAGSHQTNAPACDQCVSGYVMQSGSCVVATCAAGSHQTNAPACDQCVSGYIMQGGACVVPTCPANSHLVNPPTCNTCEVGYIYQGGACVVPPPSISTTLKANPIRVVKGQQTSLSWGTTSMAPDACTLRDGGGTVLSHALSSPGLSVVVTTQNVFTLTCVTSGPTLSSSAAVTIVPSFIEL